MRDEIVCICRAWTIHCACGKSVSHADVAKLRAEVLRLEQRHALVQCGFEASQNTVAELRCENERLRKPERWEQTLRDENARLRRGLEDLLAALDRLALPAAGLRAAQNMAARLLEE